LKGRSESEYAPQTNITRAEYLYFLVRTLGVEARVDGNFDDIDKNAYYYKEIGIAKKLGITTGTGNNKFDPDASITRQDMMVLTARTMQKFKALKAADDITVLGKFSDKGDIANYAAISLATLVKENLITGSGDRINPHAYTTRAEAAVFLYRIYNK
ncbi:MAG: multidomain protein with s-layer y region, glug motif, ig motif, i-set domain, pkd domain, partial [Anaerocolumna sp.]|nr:multidomain protein with s-layer y region, glug motif, ig motif, i-set domain, pkd domain [Anaerocolumna sp.]